MEQDEVSKYGVSSIWMFFLSLVSGSAIGGILSEGLGVAIFGGAVLTLFVTILISEPFRQNLSWLFKQVRDAC